MSAGLSTSRAANSYRDIDSDRTLVADGIQNAGNETLYRRGKLELVAETVTLTEEILKQATDLWKANKGVTRADVIANLGVIASGLAVYFTGSRFADLIVGAAIGNYILKEALGGEKRAEPNLAEAIRRRFLPLGGADELEPHPPVPVRDPPRFDR